ncbi:hypothetical protein SLS55_007285 [Diplodia seriata]|uniref:BTB domain-containing protein n=1 Tax=Diplodia seriata TaxID=420778 RepID=A0ABR3CBY9_9PEZI
MSNPEFDELDFTIPPQPPQHSSSQEDTTMPWSSNGGSVGLRMFQSKFMADYTIVCADGKEIPAHSFILCGGDFFVKAFKSNMKEVKDKRFVFEDSTDLPHLNFNHGVINCMLEFMYCGSYTEDDAEEAIEKRMCRHIDICVLADFLMVRGLKDYVVKRVNMALDDWDSVRPALPEIITALYTAPKPVVSSMRTKLTNILAKEMHELENDKAFCDFLEDFGECCVDLIREMNKQKPKVTGGIRTVCHHCKQQFLVELNADGHTPAYCSLCGEMNYNSGLRRRAV